MLSLLRLISASDVPHVLEGERHEARGCGLESFPFRPWPLAARLDRMWRIFPQ